MRLILLESMFWKDQVKLGSCFGKYDAVFLENLHIKNELFYSIK
ncbi:hypothetical protein BH11BAC5_BH11BAC5_39340 [soil metagenome]